MQALYQCDLAYIHAAGFAGLARGAAQEIVRRLRNSDINIRKVLDVGCGSGPLTDALVNSGFDVTGVDTSSALLEVARANVRQAHFVHASAYDIPLRDYDAVIAFGEPLTYHAEDVHADALLNRFFQGAAEALPPGGLLMFDVIGLGEPSLTGRSWRSGDDWAVLIETTENQSERKLARNMETFRLVGQGYRRSCEVHHVRLFNIDELGQQLTACGFAVETARSYGGQQLPPRRYAFFATRRAETGGDESRTTP